MPIISHTLEQLYSTKCATKVKIACDHCSSPFERVAKAVRADLKRGRKRLFCSKVCRNGATVNPARLKQRFECTHCRSPVEKAKDPRTKNVFCSSSCAAKHNRNGRFGRGVKREKLERFSLRSYMDFEPSADPVIIDSQPFKPAVCVTLSCEGCGVPVNRTEAKLKKMKHGKPYCSKSCRMRHYNAHVLKPSPSQRSGPEDMLLEHIRRDFPTLEVLPNDRATLSSGLEIDIHIPSAKLAVELNGPVHYLPIYGDSRFEKIRFNDARKHLEIHEKGLVLLVLDISRLTSKKAQREFIAKHYDEDVKPLLMEARVGVSPTIG